MDMHSRKIIAKVETTTARKRKEHFARGAPFCGIVPSRTIAPLYGRTG